MKSLSARRKPVKLEWSDQMKEFLAETLEDFDPNTGTLKKQPAKTCRAGTKIEHESDYVVKKRALHSSINRRLENGRKELKKRNDFEDQQIRLSFHPPVRQTKATTKRFHDHQVLERVIDMRNEEYINSAETMPNGRVIDLRKARQLPPDRSGYVKSEHRVFYWG